MVDFSGQFKLAKVRFLHDKGEDPLFVNDKGEDYESCQHWPPGDYCHLLPNWNQNQQKIGFFFFGFWYKKLVSWQRVIFCFGNWVNVSKGKTKYNWFHVHCLFILSFFFPLTKKGEKRKEKKKRCGLTKMDSTYLFANVI